MSLQAPGLPKQLGSPGQACWGELLAPRPSVLPRCRRQRLEPRRAVLGCQGRGQRRAWLPCGGGMAALPLLGAGRLTSHWGPEQKAS